MTAVDKLIEIAFDLELEERTLRRLREVRGAPVRQLMVREARCRLDIDRAERALARIPLDDD